MSIDKKILSKIGNVAEETKKTTLDLTNKTKDVSIVVKDKLIAKLDEAKNIELITQEDVIKILDGIYSNILNGLGNASPAIEDFANDYLSKNIEPEIAAKKLINNQIIKCTTSGFITGFGGLITLPISVPANISSVLYVQMRMIAGIAYMAGYDLKSDQVQTLIYACLAGISISEVVKQTGVKIGVKIATSAIKKIPGKTLTKINQKVGFRFITKFGEKGVLNLGKMVPGVGAVIAGSLDYVETKVIANRAYDWFFNGDFDNTSTDKCILELKNR